MAHVLIIDEDGPIRHLLRYTLQREGFEATSISEGCEALTLLDRTPTDLVILDVTVSRLDGWQLTRELRTDASLPILLIGASGDHTDVVRGFQLGADDYMVKPFHPEELVMRVRALLKRYGVASFTQIKHGDFMIDRAMHEVRVQGHSLILPLKEFQLLFTLASHPNQILSRSQLIEQVWGVNYEGDERTVDVHIKRLRNKLSAFTEGIRFTTVRGLGYRLDVC
ncbi:response regulator transcription factor [Paenibacillus sedimenti]|uniref:Heme response regulator HssR n=1 Tax=Paenibacillus sedimenti TaxID=2770274 RepID=A0A926QLG2_9BACL|nr:response regulator transcription factor [Paenibacillus sedimenti]MBD0382389.1 response regulator transcription factor [Paenibacillus sedimenti]